MDIGHGSTARGRESAPDSGKSYITPRNCCGLTPTTRDALSSSAGEITVLELVELLDGPIGQDATGVFAEAAGAARAALGGTTVAEIAEAEAREARAPMYHI